MARGRKSTVRLLPIDIRERIDSMIREGQMTLAEMISELEETHPEVKAPSASALSRYSQDIQEIGRELQESREIAAVWADRVGKEPEGDVGRAVLEMLRTVAFKGTREQLQLMRGGKAVDLGALEVLAVSMQKLESAGGLNQARILKAREAALKNAAAAAGKVLKKGGASRETIDMVRREILGVTG